MKKRLCRAFIKANIYPHDNINDTNSFFTIYIPEPIMYDTEQKALESNTRWDYSFGLEKANVVILIRHITVVDNNYGEIRNTPEFCYDYDTFVKLGGWIEYVTKAKNIVNIDRIHKDFNCLYSDLLNDNKEEIHINPIDMKIFKCQEGNVRIPIPISHIAHNFDTPVGNNNCNNPLVDESFYKALSAFEPNDMKGKKCHISKDYISIDDIDHIDNADSLYYDVRMQKIVNETEWSQHTYEYTVKQKREKKRALEKHGLLDAYNSLKKYLQSHNGIRKIGSDMNEDWQAPYKIIEIDLKYGYKLTGFEILEDSVIWEITTYERPIKQNDCIRGMDTCYLMYKDGFTVEAVTYIDYKLMYDKDNVSHKDYELYNNSYVDISNILGN